jgi:NADP-dependent 3-hydroxy acid dehydrogenase YdfG
VVELPLPGVRCQIDILVDNAGVSVFADPIELDADGWRR